MPGPVLRGLLALAALAPALVVHAAHALEPPAPPPPHIHHVQAAPIDLALSVRGGFAHRFGDSSGLPITSRFGGVFGVSAAISPSPSYAIGLAYEHSGLGSEHGTGAADIDATRSLDILWASLRIHVVRTDRVIILAQLGPGLAFQHVDASVIAYHVAAPPDAFNCSASGGPGLGLRVGLGVETRLAGSLWFTSDAVFDELRLGTDPLGTCGTGAGSVPMLGVRFGLTYRRDVSRYLR